MLSGTPNIAARATQTRDPRWCRTQTWGLARAPSGGLSAGCRARGRPINRILLAQRITLPQMWVSVAVLTLHVGANWLLIHRLGWGYLGAAWATALVRRPRAMGAPPLRGARCGKEGAWQA